MSTDFNDLKLVRLCLGRIGHDLRNNLSVSLSVINDLVEGYEIGKDEISDAQKSLEEALSLLKFFEPIINISQKRLEQINLSRLIAQQIDESNLREFFQTDLENQETIISADVKTLIHSLKYLFHYISSKLSFLLKNNQNPNIAFIKIDNIFTLSTKLSVRFLNEEKLIVEGLIETCLFLQADSSIEALGLIFAQNLLKENNLGELKFNYTKDEIIISLFFKTKNNLKAPGYKLSA